MAFSVVATPDSFSLDAGGSQDVVFSFSDVPADATGQATETFGLGAQQVIAALTLTLVAPNPVSVDFSVPAGVTRTLLSIDDSQAVVRYSRS
jgi:hypothetical protein